MWRSNFSLLQAAILCNATVLIGLVAASSGIAASSIRDVQVGFDGTSQVGHWTPVRTIIAAPPESSVSGRLIVSAVDGSGIPAQYAQAFPEIPAGQEQVIWSYVKFGRVSSTMTVRLEGSDNDTTQMEMSVEALPSDQQIVLELGSTLPLDDSLNLLRLRRDRQNTREGNQQTVFAQSIESASQLPPHIIGYDGIEVLVVVASQQSLLQDLTPLQRQAIESWVILGGKLIVIADTDPSDDMVEKPNSLFTNVLPGSVERIAMQRQTTEIEQFASAAARLDSGAGFRLPMAILSEVDGVVEVGEGFGSDRRPAVVRGMVGMGESVFVAFDISATPFVDWADRSRLLAAIVNLVLSGRDTSSLQMRELVVANTFGFEDVTGQLRNSLEQFQGVRLIPFSLTATLIAVYLLIVGPVDYWVLKRLGKSTWTWLTFALTIVCFTGLAIYLATSWKGNQLQLNQASIVDVDLEQQVVRGTTWMHLFAPETRMLDLASTHRSPVVQDVQNVLIWQGVPGEVFGGMDSSLASTTFSRPYQVDAKLEDATHATVRLAQFPIAVWSSRSLLNQWWGQCSLGQQVEQSLESHSEGQLRGSFTNPFPFELRDVYLVHERWFYPLRSELPANGTVRLADLSVMDLQTRLTRRRVVDGRNVMTPWQTADRDVSRILEMMMFFDAANGSSYTGLSNDYQGYLDLSRALKSGRAVMVGRAAEPAAQLEIDGEPLSEEVMQHWTYYRVQIPVKRER